MHPDKRIEVPEFGEVPDVPLQIRLDVHGEPLVSVSIRHIDVSQRRVPSIAYIMAPRTVSFGHERIEVEGGEEGIDHLLGGRGIKEALLEERWLNRFNPPAALQFGECERIQLDDPTPSSKALLDLLQEQELAGAEQDIGGFGKLVVHGFDAFDEGGLFLHFIEDCMGVQEIPLCGGEPGVVPPHHGVCDVHIRVGWEEMAGEGLLARLPCSGED